MNRTFHLFALAGLLAVGLVLFDSGTSKAQGYRFGCYNRSFSAYRSPAFRPGPIYHAPSVHYDRVYHRDYTHWTPFRGLHSHSHTHVVPHYVPGHFDYRHGTHIHPNPHYHR
jgi:hypothetical protein